MEENESSCCWAKGGEDECGGCGEGEDSGWGDDLVSGGGGVGLRALAFLLVGLDLDLP